MAKIVSSFTGVGNLNKPVVDRTGLMGEYDFILDFLPESRGVSAFTNAEGPTFVEAVRKQLGIRLVAGRAPVTFVIVDHIERSTPN